MQKYKALFVSLFLITVFIVLVNAFNWNSSQRNEVIYSDFLDLLNRGNIAQVTLKGNEVEGLLSDQRTFYTFTPGDPEVVELMENSQIQIDVEEDEGSPWYVYLLLNWGPFLLLIGVWIYFFTRMPSSGASKLFSIGKSKARKIEGEKIDVKFADVAGAEESKADLVEIVDFLSEPNRFREIGAKIPKGVLMVGPPGTGKTMLAKALAGEAGVPFFSVSGSDFVEMFVGVGASRVRDLFEEARKSAPCIIFIDEIDAVGRHRGAGLGGGHDEREQTLNQLLVEMDGFDPRSGVTVVAATNRLDILDPAILRPGRFDRHVHVSLPDIKGRAEILKVHAKKISLAEKVDLNVIAKGTPGFSGAQLANLCNEAALYAARFGKDSVALSALEWARDKIMMGAERRSLIMTDEEKRNTAYHEAGHALVSAFVERSDPIHKITIIPRGPSLGSTSFLPEHDPLTFDKTSILSKIIISMGGRAAEELVFNSYSTGVEGDLKTATGLAYNMVCKWGMSGKLGALSVDFESSGNFLAMDYYQSHSLSDSMLKAVDEEVRKMLTECHQRAADILREHAEKLHELAKSLIEKETVTATEFHDMIGPAPQPQ